LHKRPNNFCLNEVYFIPNAVQNKIKELFSDKISFIAVAVVVVVVAVVVFALVVRMKIKR